MRDSRAYVEAKHRFIGASAGEADARAKVSGGASGPWDTWPAGDPCSMDTGGPQWPALS